MWKTKLNIRIAKRKKRKEKWEYTASWEEEGQIYNLYKWDVREFWSEKKTPNKNEEKKKLPPSNDRTHKHKTAGDVCWRYNPDEGRKNRGMSSPTKKVKNNKPG